jgi:PAS domain-containing protein
MPVGEELLCGVIATVGHLPVPAYALDARGVVLAWNPALARLTGVAGQDVVGRGKGAHAVPFTGTAGRLLADLVLGPSQGAPSYLSAIERDGDRLSARLAAEILGVTRTFTVRAAPVAVRGEVIGAVEVILAPLPGEPDPTARHETVARLLRTARHDIKNELTIVLGYIGLARDAADDPTTCAGLDRAIAAAGEIGRLVEFSREIEELGERPLEIRNLGDLIRDAADEADLAGIDLEIVASQETVTADPAAFSVLEHLFERLFRYSAATVPRPDAIRVTMSGQDPILVAYEDNARRADWSRHPDRSFSRDLARGLALLRELLALDGIGLAVTLEPLRLELRIPGVPLRAYEKKE